MPNRVAEINYVNVSICLRCGFHANSGFREKKKCRICKFTCVSQLRITFAPRTHEVYIEPCLVNFQAPKKKSCSIDNSLYLSVLRFLTVLYVKQTFQVVWLWSLSPRVSSYWI